MDTKEIDQFYYQNQTGDAVLTVHSVFRGIELVYNSVHMNRLALNNTAKGNIIEIHHCREGRIEQAFEDEFFYLMPGDLSIAIRTEVIGEFTFPLNHYHGITIVINTDIAPKCFSEFLDDIHVQPMTVAKKLCGDNNCFIIRSGEQIEHIFSELYSVPENIRKGYFKVKILELLLILSSIEAEENSFENRSLSSYQVTLAKETAAYLKEHMHRRVTIAELSEIFRVSQTHLKNAFSGVYGVPIFTYTRMQKMLNAAQLLIRTNRSILDIANECGYDNASKFAAAFRDVIGESPSAYRKNYQKYVKISRIVSDG